VGQDGILRAVGNRAKLAPIANPMPLVFPNLI